MKKYRIKPILPRIAKLIKPMRHFLFKSLSLGILILGVGFILFFIVGAVSQNEIYTEKGMDLVQEKKPTHPVNLAEGDFVGTIEIPALERKIDIFEGTGVEVLGKGVGHFAQSVFPGVKDNCVLSGHNDSVFTKLDNLEIGDLIIIRTEAGVFNYEIEGTRVVDKEDKTVIVPTEEAMLTLTTCYPFVIIGPAPERFIVMAHLLSD